MVPMMAKAVLHSGSYNERLVIFTAMLVLLVWADKAGARELYYLTMAYQTSV